jgi:hypothetical protein
MCVRVFVLRGGEMYVCFEGVRVCDKVCGECVYVYARIYIHIYKIHVYIPIHL